MIHSEKSDFYEMLETLASQYGKELNNSERLLWEEDLSSYSLNAIQIAFAQWRQNPQANSFPRTGHIISIIQQTPTSPLSSQNCKFCHQSSDLNLSLLYIPPRNLYICGECYLEKLENSHHGR